MRLEYEMFDISAHMCLMRMRELWCYCDVVGFGNEKQGAGGSCGPGAVVFFVR